MSQAELTHIDNRFWIMFWDVFRQVLRGDHDKPFTIYLELIQFSLPPLLKVLPAEEPVRQKLLRAFFNKDTRATAEHLQALMAAYIEARQTIVRRFHLQFEPDGRFETEIQRIVENKVR